MEARTHRSGVRGKVESRPNSDADITSATNKIILVEQQSIRPRGKKKSITVNHQTEWIFEHKRFRPVRFIYKIPISLGSPNILVLSPLPLAILQKKLAYCQRFSYFLFCSAPDDNVLSRHYVPKFVRRSSDLDCTGIIICARFCRQYLINLGRGRLRPSKVVCFAGF